jgi:hypothetical protein
VPGLASNHDPPDLCFLSSQDSKCEPPATSAQQTLLFDATVHVLKPHHLLPALHENPKKNSDVFANPLCSKYQGTKAHSVIYLCFGQQEHFSFLFYVKWWG